MVELKSQNPGPLSAFQRYGLAVLSVALAFGGATIMVYYNFRDVELPFYLLALSMTAWYGGVGAAVLALLLSLISFDYFFVEPRYSFYITLSDLPYFIVFTAFA